MTDQPPDFAGEPGPGVDATVASAVYQALVELALPGTIRPWDELPVRDRVMFRHQVMQAFLTVLRENPPLAD